MRLAKKGTLPGGLMKVGGAERPVFWEWLLREEMGCVYRIFCRATNRSYIGQTCYSHPFVRYCEHQRSAAKGVAGPLYEDMRRYGLHEFECICVCVVENTMLNALESYYAEQYSSYVWEGGYNVGECGGERVCRELDDARRLRIKRSAIWKNLGRK